MAGAQSAVRAKLAADPGADVQVQLADGTYRLSSTWKFTAADSGSTGHPVVWRAAPGAYPVISGAIRVTGWVQEGSSGRWSAPVPTGSETRQLYVDGEKVPVAGASLADLGWNGSWAGSSSGYNISGDAVAKAWFGARSATEVAKVEFDYPGGNGPWTQSRCRVASYSAAASTLTMAQPCWTNVTNRAGFSQGSGGLPSMSVNTKPSRVENALALLSPGEWFLDSGAGKLYYQPESWQQTQNLDVALPRLETLLQGAGTLANPLHDITFTGLQFSYATWNDPSRPPGFSDVQSNLRLTEGRNQGMCTFSNPVGSCPWGALTQPLGNVAFTATTNLTLTGNRFLNLGGAGLSVMYGARGTLIRGNEFTGISSTALLLGCTYDPTPTNASEAQAIKGHCTPDPAAVGGDSIGLNEVLTNTTVSDNVIHHIGTDYSSACGITLLFSRGTKITNNVLFDLPYTAITAGVIQGHVDQASTPQNSTNINENNTISNNLFHDYMSVRQDGGAIYAEGHQAGYVYRTDGSIDPVATLAKGLQVKGNVAFNGRSTNFTYYDDAGSEWINWEGNVAFSAGGAAQGGCSATGHFWIRNNYFSAPRQSYACNPPVDSNASGNVSIPATPGPGPIPTGILAAAGLTSAYVAQSVAGTPQARYISPTNAAQVLIGGHGFTATTPVYVKNVRVTGVRFVSGGFLIVPIPAGTTAADIRVGDGGGPVTSGRIDDTDSRIGYSGFSPQSGRTFGDLNGDVHYATVNGRPPRSPSPAPVSPCTASRTSIKAISVSVSTAGRRRSSARCPPTACVTPTFPCTAEPA
ncbi:right-handed parallel beta-helix repeat-containing protein [Catellatospora tritici]|uniref:right-handed parallel beta-helix repeat-containing protein n=1 Tax=Catellatospora tritici TaxID=2851566 RepID=UPI001C2D3DDA|nr:right-handed parallel beta-helix repeat-containing protein [Catellatospora tritici]MBV1850455.1 right-handed parallel beta-helix repeat-containing protein [Catellatospora tritici]